MGKMSWLFWGAGALVAWYLIKNAGKGDQPTFHDELPPAGVSE